MTKTITKLLLIEKHTTKPTSPDPQSPNTSVEDMPSVAESKAAETPSPQQTKNKTPADADTVQSNGVESHDAESEANGGTEDDNQTETGEGATAPNEESQKGEEGEEGDQDSNEAVPVGRVDEQGQVVDDSGNVLGKVEGDVPEGSLVDTEGDVLDAEGNVIGKADVGDAAKAAEGAVAEGKEGGEKPELSGPFGVQDNGEVTNAAGVPIGKLAEGDPQDLVGQSIKEIGDEGQLKAESGSTIGKVELNPEVLDKGEEAAGENEEKKPEDEKPKQDLSILEGLKVNKMGKVVKEDVSANLSTTLSPFHRSCFLLRYSLTYTFHREHLWAKLSKAIRSHSQERKSTLKDKSGTTPAKSLGGLRYYQKPSKESSPHLSKISLTPSLMRKVRSYSKAVSSVRSLKVMPRSWTGRR